MSAVSGAPEANGGDLTPVLEVVLPEEIGLVALI